MFSKKEAAELEHLTEMAERILYLVDRLVQKDIRQADAITKSLKHVDVALHKINYCVDNVAGSALAEQLEETRKSVDELSRAVLDRRELEAEILKLKRILERREKRGKHER